MNPGFDPTNVLAFQVALPQPVNPNALSEEFTQEFQSRLQSLPGVMSTGFSNALPLIPRTGFSQPRIEGAPMSMQGIPEFREVSRSYFTAIGQRLLAGRGFLESDATGQPRVAIINQTMTRYFGGESPIGKTITLAKNPAEIVGIVDDIHDQALSVEPRPQVYIDVRQSLGRTRNAQAFNWAYFVVRGDRHPSSLIPDVRNILAQMIPGATLRLNVADMEQVLSNSIALPRLYAVLLGVFGAVAVLLAMIGVYGITTYSVAKRTREMGIRIALGGTPREVLSLVLKQSVMLATIGTALGLGCAAMVTRYLEGMLFGLTPLDPMTFVAVPAVFVLIALLAAYVPALRATRVDPLITLRHE